MDAVKWDGHDLAIDVDCVAEFERFSVKSAAKSPSQIITPPASKAGSPVQENASGNTFISVSTSFYPGANNDPLPTNLIILSSDSVFFYVHSHRLLAASQNGFNHYLPSAAQKKDEGDPVPVLSLPEPSSVFNILLHTVYNISCSHYCPSFPELSAAVPALKQYGLPFHSYIAPSAPLFATLLAHAPTAPLEVYTLAAAHALHELATAASAHLLSFPLATLTDESAAQIGPVYLKRLFFLHLGRTDALKRLLLPPPSTHAPTPTCDLAEQKRITRAWALASAYLTWDARPDMPVSTIESALNPLADHLSCDLCTACLRDRIQSLIMQWTVVKRTI